MNQMTTLPDQPSTSLPVAANPEVRHLMRFYGSKIGWIDGQPFYYGPQPNEADRVKITARLREINDAVDARDENRLHRVLARLFAVTRTVHADRAQAQQMVRDYAELLSELPIWAVIRACGKIARGDGESVTFAPGAPEIYRLAQEEMTDVLAERQALLTLLSANAAALPPPDAPTAEELRERYGEGFGLAISDDEDEAARQRKAAWARQNAVEEMRRRRELRQAGIDPDTTQCSLALLKSPLVRKDNHGNADAEAP